MKNLKCKRKIILILLLQTTFFYSQNLPIVGFGDAANYTIGTYSVPGSSGLDLHWYGGIRLGDRTGNSVMQITDGKVGIGTTAPIKLLDIQNSNGGAGESYIWIKKGFDATNVNREAGIILGTNAGDYGSTFKIVAMSSSGYFDTPKLNFKYTNPSGGRIIDLLTIDSFGNVGIGTTNPTSKLTVAGDINSREVKVTVNAGADFVFEKDYDLPSLDSVDKYIRENKHLPEIASAKEMEANGINLSEMNIKLLQKIEEQTLYIIEMSKQLHMVKQQVEELKNAHLN